MSGQPFESSRIDAQSVGRMSAGSSFSPSASACSSETVGST